MHFSGAANSLKKFKDNNNNMTHRCHIIIVIVILSE